MTIVLDELVSISTDSKTSFMRSAFAFYLLRNVLLSLNDASCPGGDFRMKVTEMLVVLRRGVNRDYFMENAGVRFLFTS